MLEEFCHVDVADVHYDPTFCSRPASLSHYEAASRMADINIGMIGIDLLDCETVHYLFALPDYVTLRPDLAPAPSGHQGVYVLVNRQCLCIGRPQYAVLSR